MNLLGTVISQTGNRIDRVEISNLRGETYYAKIFMDAGKLCDRQPPERRDRACDGFRRADLCCRAAVHQCAPTRVLPSAADGTGTARRDPLGITVQDLTPALAAAFSLPSGGGVWWRTTTPAAEHAGHARGDIVTQVDSHAVTQARDFSAGIDAVKSTGPIAIHARPWPATSERSRSPANPGTPISRLAGGKTPIGRLAFPGEGPLHLRLASSMDASGFLAQRSK